MAVVNYNQTCICLQTNAPANMNSAHLIGALAKPHQEVVGLNISVNEAFRVQGFYASSELVGQHQHSLDAERAATKVKEVLEAWPK